MAGVVSVTWSLNLIEFNWRVYKLSVWHQGFVFAIFIQDKSDDGLLLSIVFF